VQSAILISIFRVFAGMSAIVGILGIYDVFLGAPLNDSVSIIAKVEPSRLEAKGLRAYREEVPKTFYALCQPGSRLDLKVTPIFKEWKSATLQTPTGPQTVRGSDLLSESLISLSFLSALIAFLPSRLWLRWEPKWILVRLALGMVSVTGTLLFAKLLLDRSR
jgi:hypothetical protein